MPIKGDDDALASHLVGQLAHLSDYRLMATMYAVVSTDGDY